MSSNFFLKRKKEKITSIYFGQQRQQRSHLKIHHVPNSKAGSETEHRESAFSLRTWFEQDK